MNKEFDDTAGIPLKFEILSMENNPDADCNCIDCGGTNDYHDSTCSYMLELTQNE